MRRLFLSLALSWVTLACGPSVRSAGHSLDQPSQQLKASHGEEEAQADVHAKPEPAPADDGKRETQEPIRKELYATIPEGGQLVGEEGPIALEAISSRGHWVAHCSLPSGTRVSPRGATKIRPQLHLTIASRTESVDAVLAMHSDGQHLIALIDEVAWLIDAVNNRRVSLDSLRPDLRFDGLADHRSIAFSQKGVVILSRDDNEKKSARGYYLDLQEESLWSGQLKKNARSIDWGKRPVWRVDGAEQSVFAVSVRERSSPKAWPIPGQTKAPLRCLSPTGSFNAFGKVTAFRPDPARETSWTLLTSAGNQTLQATPAPGFIAPYRDGWLRREDSGRLLFVSKGQQKQIASAKCGARILRADVRSGLFFIACEEYTPVVPKKSKKKKKPKYRFDLYLIRPGFVRSLKADVMRTGIDYLGPPASVLFPVRPGASAALVDFQKKRLIPLEGDLQVLATTATRALLRRGNTLSLWTAQGEQKLPFSLGALDQQLLAGPTVAIGRKIFLLQNQVESWELPAAPLAITPHGYALVPKKAATIDRWPEGPLLLLGPPSDDQEEGPESSQPAD